MPDDQVFQTRHGTDAEAVRGRSGRDEDPRTGAAARAVVVAARPHVGTGEAPDADDRDRLHWILDHLPAGRPGRPAAVLDLGCAEGRLSFLLSERGDRVTGLDIEPSAVSSARRRGEDLPADVASRVHFAAADAHALDDVPDGTFDAAVAGQILDHVGDPVQVLTELHRALRPGATLVFTVPYGLTERSGHAETGDQPCPAPGQDPPAGRRRIFYHGSLRHLVEPLFEIRELTVLSRHLAGVAVRRDEPRGTPGFALSRAETAFLQRERLLHGEIGELRARCAELAARERAHVRGRGAIPLPAAPVAADRPPDPRPRSGFK